MRTLTDGSNRAAAAGFAGAACELCARGWRVGKESVRNNESNASDDRSLIQTHIDSLHLDNQSWRERESEQGSLQRRGGTANHAIRPVAVIPPAVSAVHRAHLSRQAAWTLALISDRDTAREHAATGH